MRNKLSLHILKALAAISILAAIPEPVAFSYDRDSIVTNNPDGSVTVTYVSTAIDAVPNPNYNPGASIQPKPTLAQVQSPALDETRPFTRPESSYDIGAIPIQASVSPTGARTYNVPIATGPESEFAPEIALIYNSQASNGLAGYGWGLSGLSSISVRYRNLFFDGKTEATLKGLDAEYSLDGLPLVKSELSSYFDYTTATGNIQVKKHISGNKVTGFTVYYPSGAVAEFEDLFEIADYPITRIEDLNGHSIEFEYDIVNSSYRYIKEIRYGVDSKISFTYGTRSEDICFKYFQGVRLGLYDNKILKEILILSGDKELSKYTLSHIVKDGVCLLKTISVSSGEKTIPPITFNYIAELSNDSYSYNGIRKNAVCIPQIWPLEKVEDKVITKKGKIKPEKGADCIIVLPKKETYTEIAKHRHGNIFSRFDRKYGSEYKASDEILCYTDVFSNLKATTITVGEGFQSVDVLDIDGDGVDEIVKINNEGILVNNIIKTRFNITVFSYKKEFQIGYGNPYTARSFTFTIDAGTKNKHYNNPSKCWYYYGAFQGNGKNMLLITTRENRDDNTPTKFVLIDLEQGYKVREQELYNMDDNPDNTMGRTLELTWFDKKEKIPTTIYDNDFSFTGVADFENDGKTDIYHITDNGVDIYSYSYEENLFKKRTSYTGATTKNTSQTSYTINYKGSRDYVYIRPAIYILDLNGDGYPDIASSPGLKRDLSFDSFDYHYSRGDWNIAYFTGTSFVSSSSTLADRGENDEIVFLDVDKDGLPDMIHKTPGFFTIFKNNNGAIEYKADQHNYATLIQKAFSLIPCDPSTAGFLGDFVVLTKDSLHRYDMPINHENLRRIESMTDSYGNILEDTYKPLLSPDGPFSVNLNRVYDKTKGFARISVPLNVLSEEKSFSMGKLSGHKVYSYTDAVLNTRGIGFCGYGGTTVKDSLSGNKIIRVFAPEKFGVITEEFLYVGDQVVQYSHFTYDNYSTTYGKLTPRLIKQENSDSLKQVYSVTSYEYGSYNLPTKVETKTCLFGGDYSTSIQRNKYQHRINPNIYIIGALTEQTVTTELDGDPSSSWMTKSETEYDGRFRPIKSRQYVGKWYPENDNPEYGRDSTNIVSETRITYDSHGNVLSKKSSAYGSTEFLGTTYTYDSDGRYLLTETNALGQTTTYSGYNKFGKPEMVTDHKGNVTRIYYDNWGKCIRTVSPDGEETSTSTAWGGKSLYTITSTSNAGPRSITHYDALGRDIRSGTQRFDGSWLFTDKVYDERGRLYKTSLPFREDEATLWAVTEYDKYDRIVKISEPTGKKPLIPVGKKPLIPVDKKTLISYSGTSVTTTKDGITSTSTSDASGNVISVTDAGGTISYSFRDDGQPVAVTAPGNAVTTFTYDRYGRRTSIADPSAGTRTESYTDNPDGSSVVTSTNPNGTITTYSDKYGRTTKVERRGEYDTEYIYDAEGRLLSEVSTNGTSTSYTYDGLDRVVSSTETVPDGYWLKTSFEFLSNGTLGATLYENNEGVITTISYEYGNGCSVGEKLPDGTYVSKLLAENELGLPTRIQTGGIFRDYEYSATGLPVMRKLDDGHLQYFKYGFDAQTGNLLMRQDAPNGQTEAFEYDNLNRLTRAGAWQFAYDDALSNIVSMDGARQFAYDALGNIVSMDGVGTMRYNNASRPYQVSSLSPTDGGARILLERAQTISYTCYSRPSRLNEGGRSASFTYNGNGDRVKMHVAKGQQVGDNQVQVMDRYYIGSSFECDITYKTEEIRNKLLSFKDKTIERLYLGGDAYTAPMVYIRENSGPWMLYNIGRDYLGSITHIATADGDLVAEYSYDPWGRLRDPQTLEIYGPGSEPELFLGRGYTSHEHLSWFGLINMNARLYDPLLGRFLSPDPYVQAPDFTQNFNRYSYALNNPLKYTDESGEVPQLIVAAFMCMYGGYSNWVLHGCQSGGKGWGYFATGCLAGVAGAGASYATSVTIGAHGFFGGATVAAAGSGASAFILGTGNSLNGGASFSTAIKVGGRSALTGAITSGIIGGIAGGISATQNHGNFWTGDGTIFDLLESDAPSFSYDPRDANCAPIEYTQENVEKFSKKHFDNIIGKLRRKISLIANGTCPGGYTIDENGICKNSAGENVLGSEITIRGKHYVLIYPSACESKYKLYFTMGHEYYHAFLDDIGILGKDFQHCIIADWEKKQLYSWYWILPEELRHNTNTWIKKNLTKTYYEYYNYITDSINYLGVESLYPIHNNWIIL